ncbi:ShlB/FhaC/HecB family hemolysin secretion/activation protein [Paraburkholderia humisilvae]|uniref:ShlB/FhaC/HecB family hemolysin secretion/activation protein n=1 Tax=Paraburkholderia humisilvae TaxID=627669 RepID=UPI0035E683F0
MARSAGASLPGISRNTRLRSQRLAVRRSHTEVETASLAVLAPFRIGNQPFSYQIGWSMQNARPPLWAPDYFMIGTRHAVCGFDQQSSISRRRYAQRRHAHTWSGSDERCVTRSGGATKRMVRGAPRSLRRSPLSTPSGSFAYFLKAA